MSQINKKLDTSRMLRIVYTDAERLQLGRQLSEEFNELRGVNSDFDRVKANFKSKITSKEANIEDLSNKVSTGYHIADVKCRWELRSPDPLHKQLFRLDTGDCVETADMVTEDFQAEMELAPPEETPPPAETTPKPKTEEP
jgi:hypothetical protein